jgi:hypothetical protein
MACVEPGEQLAFVHAIAFLHEDIGNALVIVEGQCHLPQINIAMQGEFNRGTTAMSEPPCKSAGRYH